MTPNAESFFKAVLGEDAAAALMKAADRSPALASALLPRGVLAWLSFSSNWNYEGAIPGLDDSYIEFAKTGPDSFEGFINIGDGVYDFDGASLLEMSAAVSVALGGGKLDVSIKKNDIQALGKNLDLLVKTRFLNLMQAAEEAMEKGEKSFCCDKACKGCGDCETHGYSKTKTHHRDGCEFAKVELPGKAAAPLAPIAPKQQLAPTPTAPKRTKPGQQPVQAKSEVRISKSEAASKCSVCDEAQFTDGKFTGCYCLHDLAKHARVQADGQGYTLTFDDEWSDLDVKLFVDIVHGAA